MVKYKTNKRNGHSSIVHLHVCLDEDLAPALAMLPNKSRFVNEAIRLYLKKLSPNLAVKR